LRSAQVTQGDPVIKTNMHTATPKATKKK
jgi:hypothetical protein